MRNAPFKNTEIVRVLKEVEGGRQMKEVLPRVRDIRCDPLQSEKQVWRNASATIEGNLLNILKETRFGQEFAACAYVSRLSIALSRDFPVVSSTKKRGLLFVSKYIFAVYSPMIPRHSSCTPPRKYIGTTVDAQPRN